MEQSLSQNTSGPSHELLMQELCLPCLYRFEFCKSFNFFFFLVQGFYESKVPVLGSHMILNGSTSLVLRTVDLMGPPMDMGYNAKNPFQLS